MSHPDLPEDWAEGDTVHASDVNAQDAQINQLDTDVTALTAANLNDWDAPTVHAATIKAAPVNADELALVDSGASYGLKRLPWSNALAAVKAYYDPVTSTLQNKTLDITNIATLRADRLTLQDPSDATKKALVSLANVPTSTTLTYVLPAGTTLVDTSSTQTLAGKTLTSPTLTTPALGTPTALVLTNATGLVATTGLTATGTKDSTTFLCGNNTWAVPAASGNVMGAAASVDSELALFNSTTGKVIKRASGTGVVVATAGVASFVTAPTGAIVGDADTQTLSNKTVAAPVLSGTVTGTYTLGGTPTFPATVVLTTGAQTLASKTLTSPKINQVVDTNGVGIIELTPIASAVNRIGTYNNVTGSAPGIYVVGDTNRDLQLAGVGTGGVSVNNGDGSFRQVATISGVQTLTGKTLSSPKVNQLVDTNGNGIFELSPIASAVNRVGTFNNVTGQPPGLYVVGDTNADLGLAGAGTGKVKIAGSEIVTLAATQVLINKTLTAPVIATIVNTGTLTLPTSTDTLVGRGTTDTLTSKTLTSPKITSGNAPATSGSTGTAGQIEWASGFIYVCVASNTWQRAALATW